MQTRKTQLLYQATVFVNNLQIKITVLIMLPFYDAGAVLDFIS